MSKRRSRRLLADRASTVSAASVPTIATFKVLSVGVPDPIGTCSTKALTEGVLRRIEHREPAHDDSVLSSDLHSRAGRRSALPRKPRFPIQRRALLPDVHAPRRRARAPARADAPASRFRTLFQGLL